MFSRRHFLMGSCLLFAKAWAKGAGIDIQPAPFNLVAGTATADIRGVKVPMLGYNRQTPGPTLTAIEGERLRVRLQNTIEDMATTVHWHGIRIDNAMDGVPELTQSPVSTGADFLYDFVVPDAGTYWYHTHHRSLVQLAKGLYGPLIVHETHPPVVDHDIIVIIDDWRLNEDGTQDTHFYNPWDVYFEGRLGNVAQAIFKGQTKPIKKGDRIRLRLINPATDRTFYIRINGVQGKIVALDGAPVPVPYDFDHIRLATAQRCDVIVDVVDTDISFATDINDRQYLLGTLQTIGAKSLSSQPIPTLPPRTTDRKPDIQNAITVDLEMDGGGHMTAAWIRFKEFLNANPDTNRNGWSFNGQAGMDMKTPLWRVKRGQSVILQLVNHTDVDHAIHVHGHHFYRLKDGKMTTHRDTIFVPENDDRTIIIQCDNPGKWMLHCHMLSHSKTGMMTWFEVI